MSQQRQLEQQGKGKRKGTENKAATTFPVENCFSKQKKNGPTSRRWTKDPHLLGSMIWWGLALRTRAPFRYELQCTESSWFLRWWQSPSDWGSWECFWRRLLSGCGTDRLPYPNKWLFFFFFSDGKHRLISCHILILFSSLQMWHRAAWVHCFAKQTDTVSVKKKPS